MPLFDNVKDATEYNERKACRLYPNCLQPRDSLSSLCSRHRRNNYYYGSPTSRHIHLRDYELPRIRVTEVLDRNLEHEGVSDALQRLEQVVKEAYDGRSSMPALRFAHRAIKAGVTARQILIHMAALWLFSKYIHSPLKTRRAVVMALGWRILAFGGGIPLKAPWTNRGVTYLYPKPSERLEFGNYLWIRAGNLAINLANQAYQEEQEMNDAALVQCKQLD